MHALFRWHRRLGLIAALGVISGTLSGVLHTSMSAFQAKPATLDAVTRLLANSGEQPVASVLKQNGIARIAELNVLRWQDRLWYQVRPPLAAGRIYLDARSGKTLADGDRLYAEHLARAYLNDPASKIVSAQLVTDFSDEYPRVNRLLPVWRVAFDRPDAMRVYVDTGSGKLGSLVDRTKTFSATAFTWLHRWSWLRSPIPAARVMVLSILLAATLAVTIVGLYLYVTRWRQASRQLGLRRVHRLGGLMLSAAALTFAASALYHLWQGEVRGDPASRLRAPETVIDSARIATHPLRVENGAANPWRRISLAVVGTEPYWRFDPASQAGHRVHHHGGGPEKPAPVARYHAVSNLQSLMHGDAERARAIALAVAPGAKIVATTPVTRFHGEYGFVFKRLPVQRVMLDNGRAIYVDTANGVIAAAIDGADRIEGWTFAYLHKMEWLVPIMGKVGRDIVVASVSALLLAFVVTGLIQYRRQRNSLRREQTPD